MLSRKRLIGFLSLVLPTLFFYGIFVFFSPHEASALFVSPDRLIIEKNQRSTTLVISNRSDKPVVVRFEWERRVVDSKGKLQVIGENETYDHYQPADPYLRFSPRQVILQPRQHQRVRVLVRRTDDMQPGEYHSHLLIKEEPVRVGGNIGQTSEASRLRGQLDLILYRSLPVFLREGDTKIEAVLNESYLYTKDGKPTLHVDITNNSTRSFYPAPVLNCKLPSGEIRSEELVALRAYVEAKRIVKDIVIPPQIDSLSNCTALNVDFWDKKDFDYRDKPILQGSVSRR